ncbi:MAG: hypothetical protein U0670_17110 [Anaerolineae bacterium]
MAGFSPMERAEAFLRAGELADALDALDEQIEAQPADDTARRMRVGIILRTALRDSEGEALLRSAVADLDTLTTHLFEDVIQRYQLHLKLGSPEAAFQLLRDTYAKADAIGRDPRLIDLLLEQLYQRGDTATAINLLFELPKSWRWLEWNGDFHALKGDHRVALDYYCSALDTLEESTQDAPEKAVGFIGNLRGQLLIRRAGMFEQLGLYAEAEVDLEAAETLIPGDAMIVFRRGLMIFLGGDVQRAAELCAAAIEAAKPDTVRDSLRGQLENDPRYAPLAVVVLR